MPELPEVETVRRDIEPQVVGRTILRQQVDAGPRYGDLEDAVGRRIRAVNRRGKYLLFDLGERELIVHLGMSGRLFVADEAPATPHLRAVLDLGSESDGARRALVFVDMRRFGTLRVVRPGDYGAIPTLAEMGPEPLSDEFRVGPFAAATARSAVPIKALLLGQKVVAGLGNIYVDEALHRAGIHPATRGLTRRQAASLHEAIRAVLTEAIANRGTTFRLYRDGHLAKGKHQAELRVFDQAGRPCRICGTPVEKIRLSGRGTHYCPTCQRPKGKMSVN